MSGRSGQIMSALDKHAGDRWITHRQYRPRSENLALGTYIGLFSYITGCRVISSLPTSRFSTNETKSIADAVPQRRINQTLDLMERGRGCIISCDANFKNIPYLHAHVRLHRSFPWKGCGRPKPHPHWVAAQCVGTSWR